MANLEFHKSLDESICSFDFGYKNNAFIIDA